MMRITITASMRDALGRIAHVPEDLRARLAAVTPGTGGAWTLTLSDDDATALAELVQWHVKTDPATGRPTPETQPYEDLIHLIDQAQFE